MEKIIDKNIILFNIALEYDIIDISIITSWADNHILNNEICLLYTSPSPRD